MKMFIALAAAIIFLTLLPALADGNLLAQQVVHVDFKAVIYEIWDPYSYSPPTWEEGDTIAGFYEYELGAVDQSPGDPSEGEYRYSTVPNTIWVGHKGFVYMTDTAHVDVRLTVHNDLVGGGNLWDRYEIISVRNLLEPEVLGVGAGMIDILLYDSTGTALDDDSLPEFPPVLDAWTYSKRIVISGDVTYYIRADLISCVMGTPTGIAETPRPSSSALRNYPNPFSSSTLIEYFLHRPSTVTVTVYNVHGQRVARIALPPQGVGRQSVAWNGIDEAGREVASGIYVYRVEASGFSQTRKMVVLR